MSVINQCTDFPLILKLQPMSYKVHQAPESKQIISTVDQFSCEQLRTTAYIHLTITSTNQAQETGLPKTIIVLSFF